MAGALQSIRQYWVDALAERRNDPAPREGDIASYLLNANYDDERPLTDDEMLDMLTVLVLAGWTRPARSSATCSGTSRCTPRTGAGCSRSPS